MGEEGVGRAIGWVEGLLDSHLPSFVIEASRDKGVRRALTRAMELLGGVGDGLGQMEGVMGVWTHIDRVLTRKAVHMQDSDQLYVIDKIEV